jgi:EmrB/QacA subfamily drug resistance transporter
MGQRGATEVRYSSPPGRWVLFAAVLGSGLAALDATAVNVALPAIGEDLGTGVEGLQWTINGYLLTLSALMLLGGSLGDRFGRRRIFVIGTIWFALASTLCGLAPNVGTLTLARALQGVGGALLTPGSLAIIEASFAPEDRAEAIGAWSGLGGVAAAVGPFVGGWLVDAASWRLIFLVNLPLAAVTVAVAVRHVPETSDPDAGQRLDVAGAFLATAGLGALTYGLIEAPVDGGMGALAVGAVGALALSAFLAIEARRDQPMLPLDIFSSHQFSSANIVTFAVYAALGGAFFLFAVNLQEVLAYPAWQAGAALFPVTILMLVLSPKTGRLAQRIGPRLPMTLGPLMAALGLYAMSTVDAGTSYLTGVLPGVAVFGLGLALTVAPLTATVLASAPVRHAGVASAINNAVARVGSLLAVATLPAVAGLTDAFGDPAAFSDGYRTAMLIAAALAAAGGVIAFLSIRRDQPMSRELVEEVHCAVDGPPLRPAEHCSP